LFAEVPLENSHGQFSPDSQWVAYSSFESGRLEVFVRQFPAGGRSQISNGGGDYPRWRKDGTELFYLAPDQTLMSVSVKRVGKSLEVGMPSHVFKITVPAGLDTGDIGYPYDVSGDGQRILRLIPGGEAEPQTLVVLSNWQADFRNPAR